MCLASTLNQALRGAAACAGGADAGIQYREISAEALAAEPASFDVVTCMEMLEHVPDPGLWWPCADLVKPGGWVFLSTINRNAKAFMLAIVGAEYVLNLLPRGTHEFAKLIKPSELAAYCRGAGLDVQVPWPGVQPADPALRLSQDTSVNYLFACQKTADVPRNALADCGSLFDLDGTIDSAPIWGPPPTSCVACMLPSLPLEQYRPMAGAGARACWRSHLVWARRSQFRGSARKSFLATTRAVCASVLRSLRRFLS